MKPKAGDKVTVRSASVLGLDYQSLSSGAITILKVKDCPPREHCPDAYEDCTLIYLDLDTKHSCYDIPLCYHEDFLSLEVTPMEQLELEEIVLVKGKEDVIIYEGKKHKVIKNEVDLEDLEDLIF